MKTGVILGAKGQSLSLAKAILLYVSADGSAAATVHEVENGVILPGTLLDRGGLDNAILSLAGASGAVRQVFCERVLFSDATTLCWWCPANIRPIYFQSGKAELDEHLSGRDVLHPPLLFIAKAQDLSVWALGESKRPWGSTALYVAPYFNIYASAKMCTGNVRLPESLAPTQEILEAWEEAFFGTNFTHSNNGGKPLTKFSEGISAMWKMLATSALDGNWQFSCEAMLVPLEPLFTVNDALSGRKRA